MGFLLLKGFAYYFLGSPFLVLSPSDFLPLLLVLVVALTVIVTVAGAELSVPSLAT